MSEFLADINGFNLTDEDFCVFGNLNACESRDSNRLLTYYSRVERAVDDDGLSDLFGLLGVEEVTASCLELLFNLGVDLSCRDNALLGSADHTVIEGL